jgi:hypothetical protein
MLLMQQWLRARLPLRTRYLLFIRGQSRHRQCRLVLFFAIVPVGGAAENYENVLIYFSGFGNKRSARVAGGNGVFLPQIVNVPRHESHRRRREKQTQRERH